MQQNDWMLSASPVTIVAFGADRSRQTNFRHPPRPAAPRALILLLFQAALLIRCFLRVLRYESRGYFCFLGYGRCRYNTQKLTRATSRTCDDQAEGDHIGAMVVVRSPPNGVNLTLLFMSPLSLSSAGRRCLQCATDALVDSDRPPAISGSL